MALLLNFVSVLFFILQFAIIIRALMSWFNPSPENPIARIVYRDHRAGTRSTPTDRATHRHDRHHANCRDPAHAGDRVSAGLHARRLGGVARSGAASDGESSGQYSSSVCARYLAIESGVWSPRRPMSSAKTVRR